MKRYFFNREERYYCSLLMQAIMEKPEIAGKFLKGNFYNGMSLEVYIETSIIRDYWMLLGKPIQSKNIEDLNKKREAYLKSLCGLLKIDFDIIKQRDDYKSKIGFINSPRNWKNLKEKKDEVEAKNLSAIFNMRQDILIIENGNLHFIEAKVESGNSSGQINNFLLLLDLHDKDNKTWGCIDKHFSGIENVFLYYLKQTETEFNVKNPDVKAITILTWHDIFEAFKDKCDVFKQHRIDDHINSVFKKRLIWENDLTENIALYFDRQR